MTNTQARAKARIEIIKTLKAAGLVEGNSITAAQLQNESRPAFWRGVVRDPSAKAKDVYATWEIVRSNAHTRGDDKTQLRELTIAVDIFSKRSFDSEQLHKLLDATETALTDAGFEVELANEQYHDDSKLFHQPMTLHKIY
jgi:hypothetical protein